MSLYGDEEAPVKAAEAQAPKPQTPNPKPQTRFRLNPISVFRITFTPSTPNPQPPTPNPQPPTPNPQPPTPNPDPQPSTLTAHPSPLIQASLARIDVNDLGYDRLVHFVENYHEIDQQDEQQPRRWVSEVRMPSIPNPKCRNSNPETRQAKPKKRKTEMVLLAVDADI
jgi:hypothetical protein